MSVSGPFTAKVLEGNNRGILTQLDSMPQSLGKLHKEGTPSASRIQEAFSISTTLFWAVPFLSVVTLGKSKQGRKLLKPCGFFKLSLKSLLRSTFG